jgi:hypothetical protein
MTCRPNLIWGLLAALSMFPNLASYALAADPFAESESSIILVSGNVPDITLQQKVRPAGVAAATWQPVNSEERIQESSGDIRFNKPVIGSPNKLSASPIKKPENPLVQKPAFKSPATRNVPAAGGWAAPQETDAALAKRSVTRETTAVPQVTLQSRVVPTVIASDHVDSMSGARTITFGRPPIANQDQAAQVAAVFQGEPPARPVVTRAIASDQTQKLRKPSWLQPIEISPQAAAASSTPNAQQPSSSISRPESGAMDERLQVVSQILADNQVAQAVQNEALPPSPAGASPESADARSGVRGGPELGDSAAYAVGCDPPRPRLFWTAGVEATFLSPDLNSGGVSFEVEEIDEARYDLCSTSADDIDSFYASPRIWLGVQGCAWGANLRYWHLQAAEGSFDPSIGGLGTWDDFDCGRPDLGFTSCSNLEAYTIDLELTRRFCVHDCAMLGSVGIRHADIEHNEALFGLANTDEGFLTGSARANRLSRGTGILLGLYGRKPIYPCSCVHWFYNARWSALWGPTQTSTETFASVLTNSTGTPSGAAASVNGAYTNVDDTLFVGEIQLGLEWNYALQCIPAKAFFRAAIEYQRWDGGLGFSESQSFAGAETINPAVENSILTATAAAAEPQMDLIGVTLGAGLTW